MSAMFTSINGTTVIVVSTMYHFFYVFIDSTTYCDVFIFKFMKVFFKYLLYDIHITIIPQMKNTLNPS